MSAAEKEFVLTHVVKNVSKLEEGKDYHCPKEEFFGVSWHMGYIRKDGFLGLYTYCGYESNGKWSIETSRTMRLLNATGKSSVRSTDRAFGNTGNKCGTRWGWSQFIKWDNLEKDYVIDDTVIIEAHVKILKMTGIGKKKLRNFDESAKEVSDIVLIVKNEKFYVLKLFLACQSSYFNALFLRGFKESKQSKIALSDVDPKDFQNFLEVLHGEMAIDDSTIPGILRLADMYHTQTVIQHCEAFLMEKSEKTLKEKLEISSRFNLKRSLNKCLSEIKTVEDIKSVVAGDLSKMDRSVQAALLQKSLSLR